jgi:hypothetical protein
MRIRSIASLIAMIAIALTAVPGVAKGKKDVLPPYVLTARTVSVIIDPDAGVSLDDPNANQVARKDVEAALLGWGRLQPVLVGQPADLIVVIRRGHQRLVSDTMPDPRQNDRIGGINSSDDSMQVGGRQGTPSSQTPTQIPGQSSGPPGARFPQSPATPRTEIGPPDDTFAVYNGTTSRPLDTPPAWRYIAPDALRPHTVPAVDQFRKAVAAAEKAASHP